MHGVLHVDIKSRILEERNTRQQSLVVNPQATAHQGHMGRCEGSWQAAAAAVAGGASIAAGHGRVSLPGCLHAETRASACFLPDPRLASADTPCMSLC
jgi:hypothetical protein